MNSDFFRLLDGAVVVVDNVSLIYRCHSLAALPLTARARRMSKRATSLIFGREMRGALTLSQSQTLTE